MKTAITLNGITGDIVALIVLATLVVMIFLGAFVVWSWLIIDVFAKAVTSAKKWHRFFVFIWYYNRGLKEKLDSLDKTEQDNA